MPSRVSIVRKLILSSFKPYNWRNAIGNASRILEALLRKLFERSVEFTIYSCHYAIPVCINNLTILKSSTVMVAPTIMPRSPLSRDLINTAPLDNLNYNFNCDHRNAVYAFRLVARLFRSVQVPLLGERVKGKATFCSVSGE